jgi:hypothetical protein
MVPEPVVPVSTMVAAAATVPPEGTRVSSAPVHRPAFHPSEDFNRFIARQDSCDLATMVLRFCSEHGPATTRDIAAASQTQPMAVLKVLSFLTSERLAHDNNDGLWTTSADALAEWQYRLHHAGRYTIASHGPQ